MFRKIRKSLRYGILSVFSVTGIYFFTLIPCLADDFAQNCSYGLYPTKEQPHRFCSPVGDHRDNCWFCNEEKRCYLTVWDLQGGPDGPYGRPALWELFYNSSGNASENCIKWRDKCPNCDSNGKPVTQQKKAPKKPATKKPGQR